MIDMVPWRWGNPVEDEGTYLVWDSSHGWVVAQYSVGIGWEPVGITETHELLEKVTRCWRRSRAARSLRWIIEARHERRSEA